MDLNVITRFTVASDAGIGALMYLTDTISREKWSGVLPDKILEKHIADQFNEKKLVDDLNDMLSQQWLVVYVNEYPAGFAKITSRGRKPEAGNKPAVRIAEFGILKKYDDEAVWSSLYDKCYAVSRAYHTIWLHEYAGNPAIAYFEKMGFVKTDESGDSFELPLPSVYLVKEKSDGIKGLSIQE